MNAATPGQIAPAALLPGAALRILPAGQFRAADGRPLNLDHWTLNGDNAAAIVKASAQRQNDFLIDYEHQSLAARENGKPAPAAGWFKSLEWRPGEGLFMGAIAWTDRARELIAAKEYRYLSPVFTFDKAGNVTGILSVSLTNTPALMGLSDLAAASLAMGRGLPAGTGLAALCRHALPAGAASADPSAIAAAADIYMAQCAAAGNPVPFYEAVHHVADGRRRGG